MADAWALIKGSTPSAFVNASLISPVTFLKAGGVGYTGNCEFNIDMEMTGSSAIPVGVGVDSNNIIFFTNANTLQLRRSGLGQTNISLPSPATQRHKYRFVSNFANNTLLVYQDAALIATLTGATLFEVSTFSPINNVGRAHITYRTQAINNGVLVHDWISRLSTGLVLVDQVSANNAVIDTNWEPTGDAKWQLFSTGTADTTITLESSSYAITGQPIDLRANRKIDLAPSSYSQTGSNINLLHNKRIGLDSGTYTLNGTSIELTYNQASSYLITLESSEYSAIGTDVDLLHNKRLETETGTYALIGADVNLLHNKRINLESGNYAIVGTAIDFNYATTASYRISLNSGTYEITGEELALRHNKLIGLDAGQYQSTGTALDLLYNRAINLESGNYSIIGTDIDMLFNRSISLESGEYQIDGTSINLTYSGFVELRIDGYSVMFKQSLAQANYTRNLINTQYKHH